MSRLLRFLPHHNAANKNSVRTTFARLTQASRFVCCI